MIHILFQPYSLSGIPLQNRFVMAPLTRSRTSQPGNIPNELMATYYHQRCSAGLIIAEATQISLQGQGYAHTPGIYTTQQIEGWKLVTHSVHQTSSKIFLQLWHVGRISSSRVNGLQPIAPSPILNQKSQSYIFEEPLGNAVRIPTELPREMSMEDIKQVVSDFKQAAINAIEAGFDGVEIHGAHGYLIDQFLKSETNHRLDAYGGNSENRMKFVLEITETIVQAIGKEKTGIRLSPFTSARDLKDPDIHETFFKLVAKLNELGIAYLHLSEPEWEETEKIDTDFRIKLRNSFQNTIIVTGSKTPESGSEILTNGLADLIGFGRKFISNPDYPERVKHNIPLQEIIHPKTIYGGGTEKGYTDYPMWSEK
jgi:N-ethylmaleimide reductase